MQDTRNVTDDFKGKTEAQIIAELDRNGINLEIAVENLERDFNMGTMVRSANAFGVRRVHVVGRKQWNKRGAMATDKYLHVVYHQSISEFAEKMKQADKRIIAVDNVEGSVGLAKAELPVNTVLLFGAEGPGLTSEALAIAREIVAIEQFGSTRSINVGVAAGIVMYAWLQQNILPRQ